MSAYLVSGCYCPLILAEMMTSCVELGNRYAFLDLLANLFACDGDGLHLVNVSVGVQFHLANNVKFMEM